MSRFVISHRRAGKKERWRHHRAREVMLEALQGKLLANADLVAQNTPAHDAARHVCVIDADHEEMRARQQDLDEDVLVEPHMPHYAGRVRPPEVGRADAEELSAASGSGRDLSVLVTDDDGQPLAGIDVLVYLGEGDDRQQLAQRSDAQGRASFSFDASLSLSNVAAVPQHSYWSMIHSGEADHVSFACPELPAADQGLGWWHRLSGIQQLDLQRGQGMRIGVIDTGVGPNGNLDHVTDMGSVIDAELDEQGGQDIRGHGSHVCGIIGARPGQQVEFAGLAPGADLFSMRVFGNTGGAHQGDIALAIWAMAHEQRCHLVNLSLGTGGRSEIERDAIVDALEQGCLCICAAGNTSSDTVDYPAAFEEAVAISALGEQGWGPQGSLAAHRVPSEADRFGVDALYLANFSGHGASVDAAGAGVGLISTVPGSVNGRPAYAAYGGTSMATPYVTGVLAASLAADSDYLALDANEQRAQFARQRLVALSRDVGLAAEFQGSGLPVMSRSS